MQWPHVNFFSCTVYSHMSISVEIPHYSAFTLIEVFRVRYVKLVFLVSKFKCYLSNDCLQEFAYLVENHFLSQITKFALLDFKFIAILW